MFRLKIQWRLTWAKIISDIIGQRLIRVFLALSDIDEKEIYFASFSGKRIKMKAQEIPKCSGSICCLDFMNPYLLL